MLEDTSSPPYSSLFTLHHQSINTHPNQARVVTLMCIRIRIDCEFPPHHTPLTIVRHMIFEQNHQNIVGWSGGPCEDQNVHSRFSGSNGYITIHIHIESINVVCLFF